MYPYNDEMKSSYDDVISVVNDFGYKHGNTDGRGVLTAKGTMLKNEPHLVIFHEYLGLANELFSRPLYAFSFLLKII